MYTLHYKSHFKRDLKRIPLNYRVRIEKKIKLLKIQPYLGKRLEGVLQDRYSLRIWPYRVVYSIEGNSIILKTVGHRQGVYK